MATPSDHQSVHSPATTVLTLSATSCCSPFTVNSAPSTVSSAPSSPAGDKFHQQHHDRPSIDSIAVNAIALDDDAWQHITDPKERRKIQNRIAQRKYREKEAAKREQARRDARNQQLAGGSYARPWVAETHILQSNSTHAGRDPASNPFIHPNTSTRAFHHGIGNEEFSGVPWGGLNFGHMARRSQIESQDEQREVVLRWEQRQRLLAQRDWMQKQRQLRAQRREQQQQQRTRDFQNTTPAVSAPFLMPPPSTRTDAMTTASFYDTTTTRKLMLPPQQLQQDCPIPAPLSTDTFGGSMFFDATLPFYTESTPIDPALLGSMGGCGSVGLRAMGMELDQQAQEQSVVGTGAESVQDGEEGEGFSSPTFPIEDEMEIELLAWPD